MRLVAAFKSFFCTPQEKKPHAGDFCLKPFGVDEFELLEYRDVGIAKSWYHVMWGTKEKCLRHINEKFEGRAALKKRMEEFNKKADAHAAANPTRIFSFKDGENLS